MHVRDVLESKSGQIISIAPEATVAEAVAQMVQNNIGSLPIVDAQDQLIGIISGTRPASWYPQPWGEDSRQGSSRSS